MLCYSFVVISIVCTHVCRLYIYAIETYIHATQEHLLYFVRVCIFRRVLVQRLSPGLQIPPTASNNDVSLPTPLSVQNCTPVSVDFSALMMAAMGGDEIDSNESLPVYVVSFDYFQDVYDNCRQKHMSEIAKDIYVAFVAINSTNEINISSDVRKTMIHFFENETETTKNSIQDYVDIFDESIFEVYGVLNSVYSFQFRASTPQSS